MKAVFRKKKGTRRLVEQFGDKLLCVRYRFDEMRPVRLLALGERRKMKKAKKTLGEAELQREYPLADLAEGWFFRCEETSAGCYQVEGMDLWGRIVSVTGLDPEVLLQRCVADAKSINSETQVTDKPLNTNHEC